MGETSRASSPNPARDGWTSVFDLIELNGDDLRRDPLVVRKATLASVLAKAAVGIRFNEHLEFDDGEVVFITPAGWASKASCRSGRTRPIAPAARRIGSR